MKPIYLEFCGINSFSEKAQIDFKSLLSGGVFGIFGDTGSGKSTILDSIHFALYGEIDRVPKSFNDCINYRSDGASVTFDFEITYEGVRKTYRVKRERKRKNNSTKAYLYEHTESGMLALAEGTRDVDAAVEKILGLSFADFKTCIALPQGDFAALVKSTTSERVKLVSRLFNLEKYGERLSKAVNERYYKAEEEVNLIKAKMGENEGGSEEIIAQTQAKITAQKAELGASGKRLEEAEKRYALLQEIDKAKKAYDALCIRLNELVARLPQMEALQKKLALLPKAQTVKEKADAVCDSMREEQLLAERLKRSQVDYERAQADYQKASQTLEEENYDEKILKLSLDLQRVEDAQTDVNVAKAAEVALGECIAEYTLLKNKCAEEDFAKKREEIEGQINDLGEDGTLLDYLKRNYKGVLLTDVYGEIRADLETIAQKHPQTQADIKILLKKYAAIEVQAEENSFDIATINLVFKEIERKRKTLRDELASLEKRRLAYEENENKKKLLSEKGKNLRESYNAAMQKIAFVKDLGSMDTLSKRMQALKMARQNAKQAQDSAQSKVSECFATMEKCSALALMQKQTTERAQAAIEKSLKATGFERIEEALCLLDGIENPELAMTECKQFFESYALASGEQAKTDVSKFEGYDMRTLSLALQEKEEARLRFDECNKSLGASERELDRLHKLREKYKEQQKELEEKEKHKNLCDELRQLVRSNKFLEFIACEYLQEICASASKTLLSLTGGRYFLRYDKEFKVGDNLDAGNLRAVKTLSGGETFLVSLSLALSLSAAICLKSLRPIEFFFLDEGFGTLDEKLVDTVMDVLGKLSKTFSVGLISHVEELKHRIDHKIIVSGATESRGSQVKLAYY